MVAWCRESSKDAVELEVRAVGRRISTNFTSCDLQLIRALPHLLFALHLAVLNIT